jgi:transposase-like protein
MSDDPYEGFLRAKEAALQAELASVRATLAERARLAGKTTEQPADPPIDTTPSKSPKPKRTARDKANHYAGLTVSDAVVEVLEASAVPLSTGQIWAALQKAGVEPISEDSVRAITWALRKRAINHNDVVRVAYGKWDLRSRYTEAQLRRIAKGNSGRGSLTREDHVARTKAGIENRRASGLQVGARSSMTPERRAQVERMLRGGYNVSAVAREMGVVPATIYNNFGRDRIAELRAEAKARKEQGSASPIEAGEEPNHLRVVK